ncbi:MAG: hypothetical protein ACREI8_14755 [Myxococcota bacterium]
MRRESLFGDPSFRAHLVWVTTGSSAALLLLLSAAIMLPLFTRFEGGAATLDELRSLTGQILDLHARLWPVVFTSLVAAFLSSWLLYRRMSSPLVRFVRVFRAVAEGSHPEPLQLRATDYLRREAEALNAMLEALRAREARIQELEAEVRRLRGHSSA